MNKNKIAASAFLAIYSTHILLSCAPAPDGSTRETPNGLEQPPSYALLAPETAGGYAFGTTSFRVGVSPNGDATIEVPIWVPGGRANATPELSLNYVSSGGDGLLGQGWSLSGLSVVSRCRKSQAEDGRWGGATPDAFCLDGQRLVPVASSGTDAEFRTEIDSDARIIQHLSTHEFELTPADGLRRTYRPFGSSNELWLLSRAEDGAGNNIEYSYLAGAQPLPDRITYSGNGSTAGTRSVEFAYAPRARARPAALGSYRFALEKRLERVVIKGPLDPEAPKSASVVREYDLAYGSTDVLASIQECDGASPPVCRKPVKLESTRSEYAFHDLPLKFGVDRIKLADVNGDGRTDIVWAAPTPSVLLWYVAYQQPRQVGSSLPVFAAPALLGLPVQPIASEISDPVFSDLTSDGVPEVFAYSPTAPDHRALYRRSGSTYVDTGVTGLLGTEVIADYDGDGRPDVLTRVTVWSLSPAPARILWNTSTPGALSFDSPTNLLSRPCATAEQGLINGSPATFQGGSVAVKCADPKDGLTYPTELTSCLACGYENALRALDAKWPDRVASAQQQSACANTTPSLASLHLFPGSAERAVTGSIYKGGYEQIVADFDGNGVPEVVFRDSLVPFLATMDCGYKYLEPAGPDPFMDVISMTPGAARTPRVTHQLLAMDARELFSVDRDGDGVDDLGGIYDAPNDGTADLVAGYFSTSGSAGWTPSCVVGDAKVVTRVADLDLDGSPEVLAFNSANTTCGRVPSAADGFATGTGTSPERNLQIADVNGDLLPDIVTVQADGIHLHLHRGATPALITRITQERAGAQTSATEEALAQAAAFDYAVIGPDSGLYTAGATCDHRQDCLLSGRRVVSKSRVLAADRKLVSATSNLWRSQTYSYEDGRVDRNGRGWLGFAKFRSYDEQTRSSVELSFGTGPSSRVCSTSACDGPYLYEAAFGPSRKLIREDDRRDTATSSGFVYETEARYARALSSTKGSEGDATIWRLNSATARTSERAGAASIGASWAPVSPIRAIQVDATFSAGVPLQLVHRTFEGDFDATGNIPTSASVHTREQTLELTPANTNAWPNARPKYLQTKNTEPNGQTSQRTTLFEYDPAIPELLRKITYEPGTQPAETQTTSGFMRSVTFNRASDGLIESIVEAGSGQDRTTSFTYSADRVSVKGVKNPFGHETASYVSPALGIEVAFDDAMGARRHRRYDRFGDLRGETDPRTYDVEYHRAIGTAADRLGLEVQEVRPLPSASVAAGPQPSPSFFAYDALGRLAVSDSAGWQDKRVTRSFQYDLFGRGVAAIQAHYASEPNPPAVTLAYDNLGELIARTAPAHNSAGIASEMWSHQPLQTRHIAADGARFAYRYDALGRTLKKSSELFVPQLNITKSIDTKYTYTPLNQVRTIEDAAGNVLAMKYDALGRREQLDDPDSGTEVSRYNAFGELKYAKNARGQIVETAYDLLGRPTSRTTPHGSETFAWDPSGAPGQLKSVTSAFGVQTELAYDGLGRRRQTTWRVPVGTAQTLRSYEYQQQFDGYGRADTVDYPAQSGGQRLRLKYQYSRDGQATDIFRSLSGTTGMALLWHRGSVTAGGQTEFEQFGDRLITKRVFKKEFLDYQETRDTTGLKLQRLKYQYDAAGRVGMKSDLISQVTEKYSYDQLQRLERWDVYQSVNSACSQASELYGYDDIGNLKWKGEPLANNAVRHLADFEYGPQGHSASAGPHAVTAATRGGARELLAYDPSGNQQSSPTRTIAYSWFNLPLTITANGSTHTFRYDGFGGRVLQEDVQKSLVTVGGVFEEELTPTSNRTVANVFVEGALIAKVEQAPGKTDATLFMHPDALGSPELTTDGIQAVARAKYSPFGQALNPTDLRKPSAAGNRTSSGFTGHQPDEAFGLINMKGRIYDPATARFLSPDPVIPNSGSGEGLNRYAYVLNDPINHSDPTGYWPEAEIAMGLDPTSSWSPVPLRNQGPPPMRLHEHRPAVARSVQVEDTNGLRLNPASAASVGLTPPKEPRRPYMDDSFSPVDLLPVVGSGVGMFRSAFNAYIAYKNGDYLQMSKYIGGASLNAAFLVLDVSSLGAIGTLRGAGLAVAKGASSAFLRAEAGPATRTALKALANEARILESSGAAGVADDLPELSGILRDAADGKGNFGVGSATREQANAAGQAWVGPNSRVASDGKTMVSGDGMRVFRPPATKPRLGKVQANFEQKVIPDGQPISNGHLDITDP